VDRHYPQELGFDAPAPSDAERENGIRTISPMASGNSVATRRRRLTTRFSRSRCRASKPPSITVKCNRICVPRPFRHVAVFSEDEILASAVVALAGDVRCEVHCCPFPAALDSMMKARHDELPFL
jgi:hypothetical protein